MLKNLNSSLTKEHDLTDLLTNVLQQFVIYDVVILKRRGKVGNDCKRYLKYIFT
jgi:hypothetical protein